MGLMRWGVFFLVPLVLILFPAIAWPISDTITTNNTPLSEHSNVHTNPWQIFGTLRYTFATANAGPFFPWSELYGEGIGGSLELSRDVLRGVGMHGGIGYDHFGGKTVISSTGSGAIGSLSPFSFYTGFRFFLIDLFHLPNIGIRPFLRIDLGGTYFRSIQFGGTGIGGKNIDFAYGIGGGVIVSVWKRIALFGEIKYQDYGQPDGFENSFTAIPIALGIRVGF